MRTKIISAFPGTGKSDYCKLNPTTTLDLDSTEFDEINFPQNYIKHIQENIGKFDFIFVSTHKQVRQALLDNCIFHYLVYPKEDDLTRYMQIYKNCDYSDGSLDFIENHYFDWIRELKSEYRILGSVHLQLQFDENIEALIKRMF